MKNYCKNCKFFNEGGGQYENFTKYCFHKSNIDYNVMGYSFYKRTVFIRNENYNCVEVLD